MKKVYLAFDIGASNGRAIVGEITSEGKIQTEQIYRFPNGFSTSGEYLSWNHQNIYDEMINALKICKERNYEIACIGIDTWGQDFGYIGEDGNVLAYPRCYREPEIAKHASEIDSLLGGPYSYYLLSGQTKCEISTLRQLYYDMKYRPGVAKKAKKFLYMPYLFAYLLTGEAFYDSTLSAMGEIGLCKEKTINADLLEKIGFDKSIIPNKGISGTIIGQTNLKVKEATGYDKIPVACIDAHDSNTALISIASEDEYLFVSSGTWSMYGAVTNNSVLNKTTYEAKLASTPMGDGRYALMAGTAGMFLMQACMKKWKAEGFTGDFNTLHAYAEENPSEAWFDFDKVLATASDMPSEISKVIVENGFKKPETISDIYTAFSNSLARLTANDLLRTSKAIGKKFNKVYIVGGGSQATDINRRIEKISGLEVHTGIIESAVTGNLLTQMIATKELADFVEARKISNNTFCFSKYDKK